MSHPTTEMFPTAETEALSRYTQLMNELLPVKLYFYFFKHSNMGLT